MSITNIRTLIAAARDTRATKKSRVEALNTAEATRKKAKISWSKVEAGFSLEGEMKSIESFKVKDRKPAEKKQGVCHYVREQLTSTTKDYGTILAEVLKTWPEAKTSHKSIASLARDLRREGTEVASRRQAKKEAEAPATETPAVETEQAEVAQAA